MKCPVCEAEGRKSILYGGDVGSRTLMYCKPYYDEDGNYHHHDLNWSTTTMSCSNGHRLSISSRSRCPSCDFGGEKVVNVIAQPAAEPQEER